MTTWTPAELDEIDTDHELRIASRRPDGSLRSPVTIWMVRVHDDGTFEPADPSLADAISEAYEATYAGRYPREYVDPVVSVESSGTALRVVPVREPAA
ncbi:DUF2255 family protein [Pseudolysinimonas sp.]|uniref:DUF2255 family protein n=1 Tax=Pseudolysinimonas sp. TaxID=2680009 RepID=UPI003F81E9D3